MSFKQDNIDSRGRQEILSPNPANDTLVVINNRLTEYPQLRRDFLEQWRNQLQEQTRAFEEVTDIQLVPLSLIDGNPFQPRLFYDERGIVALAEDIRQQRQLLPGSLGLLQIPLGCLTDTGRVQLAFGHRRLAAFGYLAQHYGTQWQRMPVEIENLTDEAMADFSWSENEARSDITAIEKAWALQRAMDFFNYSDSELARRRQMHKSTLSNLLRLLQLPVEVQEMVQRREILETHARVLLPLIQVAKNEAEAIKLARVAAEDKLQVTELAEVVAAVINQSTVKIETPIIEFQGWGDLLPTDCATICTKCENYSRRKLQSRCSRPELHQKKYQIWLAKRDQPLENETIPDELFEQLDLEDLNSDDEVQDSTLYPHSIFKCPRCKQDQIVIEGMAYRCAGCRVEWSTVTMLLAEINARSSEDINSTEQNEKAEGSKLDQAITQAIIAQGVQFEAGKTWNDVPATKCLGGQMTFAEFKEALKGGKSEFNPKADGIVAQFCPYLRLFPHYARQFTPSVNGSVELEINEAKVNLYPPETVSKMGQQVRGEYTLLLHRVEAYCVDPRMHQVTSCFRQREAEAAQTIVTDLKKKRLPAVLPEFIKDRKSAGEFTWLQPQVEAQSCTPESCTHRKDKPAGYVVIAQPGGQWQMGCIHAECGGQAKEALINREAEQQRLEQQRRQAALDQLWQRVIERTLLDSTGEGIHLSSSAILATIEALLVPNWDERSKMLIITGWQQAVQAQLAQEMDLTDSIEIGYAFEDRFAELAEKPTPDTVHSMFTLLREKLVYSSEELSRWLACLALVRSWRDEVSTIEQIEEAMRRILAL